MYPIVKSLHSQVENVTIVAILTLIMILKIRFPNVCLTFIEDVAGRAFCAAGQEVLPDGEDQTSGIQAPAAEESAPVHIREEEGHCSSCQKRPGEGEFGTFYQKKKGSPRSQAVS